MSGPWAVHERSMSGPRAVACASVARGRGAWVLLEVVLALSLFTIAGVISVNVTRSDIKRRTRATLSST